MKIHTESLQMTKANIRLNKQTILNYIKISNRTLTDFSELIGVDSGNFSKMLDGKIPTPKHVIEKTWDKTRIPPDALLRFEITLKSGD